MTQSRRSRVVEYSILIVIISMGTRQTFGIYLQPISESLGIGREIFSLAIATQNIIFGLPIIGILADRYGSRWVAIAGGVLFSLAMFLLSMAQSAGGLLITLGLLAGVALSSTSYVIVLGAVAQVVARERQGRTFGLITAAGSFGMFAVVPAAQWILTNFGWRNTFMALAIFVLIISALATGYPRASRSKTAAANSSDAEGSLLRIMRQAKNHSGYWLLNLGFFVCGFHVAFVATHLPAYLTDNGLTPTIGATALSLVGLFNLAGSYLFGYLGDFYRKKYLLSAIYLGRAVVFAVFILVPITNTSALVFGSAIGFLWLATVPLTSGMVAQIFGSRYLSTLYGFVFFSHQIGAFLGVWLGGRLYDTIGNYTPVWLIAIGLAVVAFVAHLPISDRPMVLEVTPTAAD